MRSNFRRIAAALLVALLFAQQLPSPPVAFAAGGLSDVGRDAPAASAPDNGAGAGEAADGTEGTEGAGGDAADEGAQGPEAAAREVRDAQAEGRGCDGEQDPDAREEGYGEGPVLRLPAQARRSPSPDADGTAYAVWDPGARTLTMMRSHEQHEDGPGQVVTDVRGVTHAGTVFGGVETMRAASELDVPWHDDASAEGGATSFSVAEGSVIAPVSCGWWFYELRDLESVDLSGLDASRCESFERMFGGCESLSEADLSGLDMSAAESVFGMFSACVALRELDLPRTSTPLLRDARMMCASCGSLERADLDCLDLTGATKAFGMFMGCDALAEVALGRSFSFGTRGSLGNQLPTPPTDETHSGRWVRADDETLSFAPSALASAWDGATMAGAWVWERWHDCPLTLDLAGGTVPEGVAYPGKYAIGHVLALPGTDGSELDPPVRPGCTFECWKDEVGGTVQGIDAESRGPRTLTAVWREPQLTMTVPVAMTFEAIGAGDGTVELVAKDGDFSLGIESGTPVPVRATARATAADGFAIGDAGGPLGDMEADVWMTPVTTGADPSADGYDPEADEGYAEHGVVRLSRLVEGTQVGPDISPYGTLWLNKLGGAMGGWSAGDGSKALLATIVWTFALAPDA